MPDEEKKPEADMSGPPDFEKAFTHTITEGEPYFALGATIPGIEQFSSFRFDVGLRVKVAGADVSEDVIAVHEELKTFVRKEFHALWVDFMNWVAEKRQQGGK